MRPQQPTSLGFRPASSSSSSSSNPGLSASRRVAVNEGKDLFQIYETRRAAATTLLVLFHGAGLTSLSFSAFASSLPESFACLAFDLRGHGKTRTEDESDLSVERLLDDAVKVLNSVLSLEERFATRNVPIFLCGHSLGGAIAVKMMTTRREACGAWREAVRGVIVLDAVEGVVLSGMEKGLEALKRRPRSFTTIEEAIQWSLTRGPLRGAYSASISVPDQLEEVGRGEAGDNGRYVWRTDLVKSAEYWPGWFTDLSQRFLEFPGAKLLVLSGVEKLDTPLSIGQMQGKYQLVVVSSVEANHFLQEDNPGQLASIVVAFCRRYGGNVVAVVGGGAGASGATTASNTATTKTSGFTAAEILALKSRKREGEEDRSF